MLKIEIKKVIIQCRALMEKKIQIADVENSLKLLKASEKSLCRFGDGEFDVIHGGQIGFQSPDQLLAKRLDDILKNPIEKCMIAVPDAINTYHNITDESKIFWVNYMYRWHKTWTESLQSDYQYLSTNMTRLYIRYKDKSVCSRYFQLLKDLWDQKDVLIVEGEETRLGAGNDLLSNARSIKRILCPAKNAFEKYDIILDTVKQHAKDKLVLLALGPTATILAYDLAKSGYCAYDIGHCDVEYEWFLLGTTEKVKLDHKFTNEVEGGNAVEQWNNQEYLSQILVKI